MISNKIIEKVMGKLVLDLDFREMLFQNPRLVLAQEGLAPVEIAAVLPHLKWLNSQQLKAVDDKLMPLGPWLA